jgi:uncharacterized FAD-dependent dehydrogenase
MEFAGFEIKEISLTAQAFGSEQLLRKAIFEDFGKKENEQDQFAILRKSLDARGRQQRFHLKVALGINAELAQQIHFKKEDLPFVGSSPPVLVIGAGPAGLFAALELIKCGVKPVVVERGKDVRARRRDLADLNKADKVNPDSNYCFGEGGAGTYSDGKLYTRSNKRGDIRQVLEMLVVHGASEEILVEAHPHIGTNKLPPLVAALRETILEHGGEIHFETRVEKFWIQTRMMKGIFTQKGEKLEGKALVLATGHSARDIFQVLQNQDVFIEAKPFALGFRVEHPQALIDEIQYKSKERSQWLPAASYSLVHQANTSKGMKGVFSFCMCPGGFIVPAMTQEGELVVNGMSPSRRNSRFANSGIVVSVDQAEFQAFEKWGPLAAMAFQAEIEKKAASFRPGKLSAPAQRLTDFLNNNPSQSFPECSYQPGLHPAPLKDILPPHIAQALKIGFQAFEKKMKGYLSEEAVLVGMESRTSSPVKIPRDKYSAMHPQISGLFPCGEGAGYAGGIMSAALDGIFVAREVARFLGQPGLETTRTL